MIDSFEQLMDAWPDFTPIYAGLGDQSAFRAGKIQPGDRVIHRDPGGGWQKTNEL